jgi:hypothetical protein
MGSVTTMAPKRAKAAPDLIAELPFVKNLKHGQGRCWWHVSPADHDDSMKGNHWALEYLRFEVGSEGFPLLGWIVADMPRKLSQLEIGFLGIIGFAAREGLQEAERLVKYWEECRARGDIPS